MSELIDHGNWLVAAVLALGVSAIVQYAVATRIYTAYEGVPVPAEPRARDIGQGDSDAGAEDDDSDNQPSIKREPLPLVGDYGWRFISFSPSSIFGSALGLAVLYVPACILVMVLFGQPGSFGVVFRRDYVSLLTCTLMAWSAAHLPIALAGLVLTATKVNALNLLIIWAAAKVYFAVLMVCALRTVFGSGFGRATATVCLSWLPVLAEPFLMSSRLIYYLASPFLLFYLYRYFRGEVSDLGVAMNQHQGFRRHLESAMVNPHDAEAHYQLGVIYQRRHQYAEAIERFKQAVEIDSRETDAHYQLGVIARSQGKLPEAIDRFSIVVAQDDKHAMSEIWREIGATYLSASMLEEAHNALDRFVERRPYDAQGLYLLGETLLKLGRAAAAKEIFNRCIEAVKTTPYYRRGEVRKWRSLAERQVRSIRVPSQEIAGDAE